MKDRIVNFLTVKMMHNIGYKILSVVIAVVVWLIVINVADPITTRTFSGLEVELLNQSAITSINQVYEVLEGNSVDFAVKGKASVIKNLKISDFHAYADLSQLSPVLATDIVVECDLNENIEIDTDNKMLLVKLEDVKEKNFQVVVETTGQVAQGYYVGDYEVKPNIITVSAGASKINQIDSIKVIVNVDGAKKSFSSKVDPVAFDNSGKVIDSSNFMFSNSGAKIAHVTVNTTIFKTKTIPVILKITGEPQQGYEYNGDYEYTPKSVKISGPARALKNLDSIEIPLDITGAMGDYETNISVNDYLPDNVDAVNSDENISIRVVLESMFEKSIEVAVTDIELRNVPELYEAKINSLQQSYMVTVRGTKNKINQIDADDIKAYVDFSNVKEGESYLPIQFDGLSNISIISETQQVNVVLQKEQLQTLVPEPSDF